MVNKDEYIPSSTDEVTTDFTEVLSARFLVSGDVGAVIVLKQ